MEWLIDSLQLIQPGAHPVRFSEAGKGDRKMKLPGGMNIQQMMQQAHDYKEEAMAVQSDSDSSVSTKKSSKSARKTRERSNSPEKCHGRSSSCHGERERNKRAHCKHYRHYASKHDKSKCYFNKKWKGWRPKYVCEGLEIKFKSKSKFTKANGWCDGCK